MNLSLDLRERLCKELKFVKRKFDEEDNPFRKIYFFSAVYGSIDRTMRYCKDDELLLDHAIFQICYNAHLDRLNRLKGGDKTVQLPSDWYKQLSDCLSKFIKAVENDEKTYLILEKLTRLTYNTTGPGYYTKLFLESSEATDVT